MKKNNILKKYILYIICFLCIVIIAYYGYKIILWCKDNNKTQIIINQINDVIPKDTQHNNTNINLSKLKEINSETVGWIKVQNTNIDYPVVQTSNNEFYLNHSFDRSYNKAGWIFLDSRNALDNTDKNIIIYGHNRRNDSMFGTLKKVLNKEWYENEENLDIIFIQQQEEKYKIFSIYKIEKEDYYLTTEFNDENEFENYIYKIKNRSIKDFKTDVSKKDTILTLSILIIE